LEGAQQPAMPVIGFVNAGSPLDRFQSYLADAASATGY
jgi:hypothetical protein